MLGVFVCLLAVLVSWRARSRYNKLKASKAAPVLKPHALSSSLPIRAAKGLAYRAESSRIGQALSNTKKAARRSLESFAANAEIDREIAKTVRGEYPTDKTVG
jgi:hypothetical protein